MSKKTTGDNALARGFYRLQINEAGKIVGDSGWRENTITNNGYDLYICRAFGAMSGSLQVSHAALGTGTAPAVTDTTLNGELTDAAGMRCAVTPTTIASKTIQFAFTLNSGVATAARTIQNVGLFNTSTTNAGSIMAGNTYTTSALATNQAVQGSYQIRVS